MEKSIGNELEYGLEYWIRRMPEIRETDPEACPPLVLAYIGDCVFDMIIRMMTVGRGSRQVHRLHEETSHYVQASSQSYMMRAMQPVLTAQEHAVYRRGRNAKSVSPAKNQSITDYRRATGFEALLGYLYLRGEYRRLTELVTVGLKSIEDRDHPAQDKEEDMPESKS